MNCFIFGEGVTELYVMEYVLKHIAAIRELEDTP
jgi:hypothetical protein